MTTVILDGVIPESCTLPDPNESIQSNKNKFEHLPECERSKCHKEELELYEYEQDYKKHRLQQSLSSKEFKTIFAHFAKCLKLRDSTVSNLERRLEFIYLTLYNHNEYRVNYGSESRFWSKMKILDSNSIKESKNENIAAENEMLTKLYQWISTKPAHLLCIRIYTRITIPICTCANIKQHEMYEDLDC